MTTRTASRLISLASAAFLTVVILAGALLAAGCATASQAQRKKTAEAHYKLGLSYLNENQTQLAFVEFQKSIEDNPKDKDTYYGLGHVYFMQGRYPEAADAFLKAIKLEPDFSEAHNYLGTVYERMDEIDKAIAEYNKAIENPQYVTPQFARHNLGMIYLTAGNYKQAEKEFQDAIRVAPDYALAYNGLGQAYYRDGKYEEAKQAFDGALKIVPDYPEVHFYLGQIYFKTGSNLQAKQEFESVIRLAPKTELARKAKQNLDLLR